MKKRLALVLIVILLMFVAVAQAKECIENLRPKLLIEPNEDLIEYGNYQKQLVTRPMEFLDYVTINSNLTSFWLNKTTGLIDFTPKSYDVGEHKYIFIAVNSLECYTSKLVTFKVWDRPSIIPIQPLTQHYIVSEGENPLFKVNISDKDNDIKEYSWYVNNLRQAGSAKTKFVLATDYTSAGNYNITLFVRDAMNLNDTHTWKVRVNKRNRKPYFKAGIPNMAVKRGGEALTDSLDLYFGDSDKEVLRYQIDIRDENGNKLDVQASINENNQLSIIAPKDFQGVMLIEIIAMDSSGEIVKSNVFKLFVFGVQGEFSSQTLQFHVCGDKVCGGNESCSNCDVDCGPCLAGMYRCENDWSCTEWSECILPGFNIRKCVDQNECVDQSKMPTTGKPCTKIKSCYDGIKNQAERGVDCGGPCNPCPSCDDFIQNQGEQGVDCGGPCNKPCPTCNDNLQNQWESDVDCGGPCNGCEDLLKCFSYRDCKSHVCKEDICQVPNCFDNVRNQNENGVDCEGVCGGVCPTCDDGILNQDEERIDCGGSCDPCPTCNDEIKNQKEIFVDCGGSCDKCTWEDFKSFNMFIAWATLIFAVLILIFTGAVIVVLISQILLLNAEIDSLLKFDNMFRKKKKYLKNQSQIIEDGASRVKQLMAKQHELKLQKGREELMSILNDLLESFQLYISNDKDFIIKTLKAKGVKYPVNRIILYLVDMGRETRDQFMTELVFSERLEMLNKIYEHLKKHS
ncbi:hypothetical protein GOV08_01540 [Candidatus Woesearchaeota archaeon]|nr:hypothetical protein [Candidatus Woesearchaeota archaeon]